MLAHYRREIAKESKNDCFYKDFLSMHKHSILNLYKERPKILNEMITEDLEVQQPQIIPDSIPTQACKIKLPKITR